MLLAADIGNTTVAFGIFRRGILVKRFSLPTARYSSTALLKGIGKAFIDTSIICSVVPRMTPRLRRDFKRISYKEPYVVGEDIRVPVPNLYRKPEQVGQDRLVNAYAGSLLAGLPLVVVDFGTAITFDAVSRKGEYLGGMILPGLRISLEALAEDTALLPRVLPAAPKEFIGRDTAASMLSGVVNGAAGTTEAFVTDLKKKLGPRTHVVATGGDAALVARLCPAIGKTDPDLTLKGLNLLLHDKGFVVPTSTPWRPLSKQPLEGA